MEMPPSPKSQLAQWKFIPHTHAVPSVVRQARTELGKGAQTIVCSPSSRKSFHYSSGHGLSD